MVRKLVVFQQKNTIFSDYQNLGHLHYFPQIIFKVFSLLMTLSIYYQYSKL